MTFSLGSTPRSLVKYNDKSIDAITEIAASAKDDMVLIKTLTASSSGTLDFVDGASDVVLDNTYPIYVFKFINIHPQTDEAALSFQGSTDTGSSYGVAITNTVFQAYHNEADTAAAVQYQAGDDFAQSTSFVGFMQPIGNENDQCGSGTLHLFNPSSTTFVKHYMTRVSNLHYADYAQDWFTAGYINTTSAIDAIQFKMSSGNIDAGTIKLYGIKDS